jgi:hypothetical protein
VVEPSADFDCAFTSDPEPDEPCKDLSREVELAFDPDLEPETEFEPVAEAFDRPEYATVSDSILVLAAPGEQKSSVGAQAILKL